MSYTIEQKKLIQEAGAQIASDLGLPSEPAKWEYGERVSYNKRLADYILSNPGVFGTEAETLSLRIKEQEYSPLEDTGFSIQLFSDELLKNADSVNPFSSENRIGTFITLGLAAAVGLYALKFIYGKN